jgi:hypothetical protein
MAITGGQPFDDRDLQLLVGSRQAMVALHNARLFNGTQEALERQTATADILNVISSSHTDLQPVFDAIVRNAAPSAAASSPTCCYSTANGCVSRRAATRMLSS